MTSVWCQTCDDYTLINLKKVCPWCDTPLKPSEIQRARLQSGTTLNTTSSTDWKQRSTK